MPGPSAADALESVRFAASSQSMSRSVGFGPELDSGESGWSNLALYAWRGRCGLAQLEPFDEPVIFLHVGGSPSVPVRAGQHRVQRSHPGLITVVPPGTAVSWDVRGEVHSRSLHLDARFFSVPEAPLQLACCVQDTFISAAMLNLEQEILSPVQCGSLYADSVAETLALHLLRRAQTRSDKGGLSRSALARCLDLLEASIESGVSLQSLADVADLSRAHFGYAFHRSLGASPHRYLTQRRIARARELLCNRRLALSEIALRCGFSSHAHFSDVFRRHIGVSPRQFRGSLGPTQDVARKTC